MPLNQATILAKALSLFETRTGAMRYQRMKFSVLAKDGLVASGRELVGITEFKGKLQSCKRQNSSSKEFSRKAS
jgi:hypothetical protein